MEAFKKDASRRGAYTATLFFKFFMVKKKVWVRIPSLPHYTQTWGISSSGRAPALQAGGDRFESGMLHVLLAFTVHASNIK